MSFYNMLHGQNIIAPVYMAMLNLTPGEVGRFRDCYLKDGNIVIYTRNGGGNREDYQEVFDILSEHENYLYDKDDDFDCTYASIYFSIPEKYKEDIVMLKLAVEQDNTPPAEKWEDLFNRLGIK